MTAADGDVERARAEVRHALEMEPGDEVTGRLAQLVEEVHAGKRERPIRFPF